MGKISYKNSLKKNWKMALLSILLLIISVSGCLDSNTPPAGDNIPPSVLIISPTGSEYWAGGSTKEITWIATDENIQENSIKLYYSIDGGNSWEQIVSDEINDGSYNWTLPIIDSSNVKIKVEAKDKAGNTNSNCTYSNFTIDSTNPIVNNIKIHDITLDSFNSISNGDDIRITASVADKGLNSGDTKFIVADLSSFGYNSTRQADSYDGNTATWILLNITHEPLIDIGTVLATLKITAYDPANLSSSCTENIRVYPLKVAIIEFAPYDVLYGDLIYWYSDLDACYRIQTKEEYIVTPGHIIGRYNFLQVFNNPEKQFFSDLKLPYEVNPRSVYYIGDYYKNEAIRYDYQPSDIFDIQILGPFSLTNDPPKRNRTTDSSELKSFFDEEVKNNSINISNYDIIVYAYFHDQVLSHREYCGFTSTIMANTALICLDTSITTAETGIETVAHELAHILGASDQYIAPCDRGNYQACCEIPDGLPEPDKIPLYPQEKACLMCGSIVVSEVDMGETPASLDYVVICTETAEEIGWINN